MSHDTDFSSPAAHKKISEAMKDLGFENHGNEFTHKKTNFFVEFPTGPLTIGNESIKAEGELEFNGNKLQLLSPTQSVMDNRCKFCNSSQK